MQKPDDLIAKLTPERQALLYQLLKKEDPEHKTGVTASPSGPFPQRRRDRASFPLSPYQENLWFHEQFFPGAGVYTMAQAWHIEGPLDGVALDQSLAQVIERHEILRTTFEEQDGQPVQSISGPRRASFISVDLELLAPEARESARQRLLQEEAGRPFNLARGPLVRGLIIRSGPGTYVFCLSLHHLIADGWSWGILAQELAAGYRTLLTGEAAALAPLPLQYVDYACWQREQLAGQGFERSLSFWKEQLRDAPTSLALPKNGFHAHVPASRGATRCLALPPALSQDLKRLGQREHVTLFTLLLFAFFVLLHLYSRQEDLVIGTPAAYRPLPETEEMIGYFLNTLTLRTRIDAKKTLRQVLNEVKQTVLSSLEHKAVPFSFLMKEWQTSRTSSSSPLQVLFVLQNAFSERLDLVGCTVCPLSLEGHFAKAELTLNIEDGSGGLQALFEYNTEIFHQQTIAEMATCFQALLERMCQTLDEPVARLSLSYLMERKAPPAQWQTRQEYQVTTLLHECFEQQAERTPEAIAVAYEEQQITFSELNARADQLASALRRLGVRSEVHVALYLERSPLMLIGILGILKAGGVYVPIDISYPAERVASILADAAAAFLLTEEQLRPQLPPGDAYLCLDQDWWRATPDHERKDDARSDVDQLAYCIYTSGSTGKPKGSQISHASVLRLLLATRDTFQFGPSDVWTLFHSISFDFSVWEIWGALLHGGRLVIVPYWASREPEAFYTLLLAEQVTVLNQTPSAFYQLIQEDEHMASSALGLRLVIFGGEALHFYHLRPWFTRHPADAPQLVNMYGITETTVHTTLHLITERESLLDSRSIIGHPLADVQTFLFNDELQPVPAGAIGEIYVGGPGLARGYLHRPDLTAERFLPDPFSASGGQRLYKTGDLARWLPGGELEYLGRRDQQVKLRGFRIEPGEIEAILSQSVQRALVVLREDVPGHQRLVAYVVPHQGQTVKKRELRAQLRPLLPDYMLPSDVVVLDTIPTTVNGKVDYKQLPVPEAEAEPHQERDEHIPLSPLAETVLNLWKGLLDNPGITLEDNFFELGGHSLLATQLIASARRVSGISVPFRQFFEAPTVAGMVRYLEQKMQQGEEEDIPPLVARTRKSLVPLSCAQQRLWFLQHLEPESTAYHIAQGFCLRGKLNFPALLLAFREIICRHEILRTAFLVHEGQPVQKSMPAPCLEEMPVSTLDLSALAEYTQEAEVRNVLEAARRRSFDFARGHLLRFCLLRLDAETHIVFLSAHHMLLDGWSLKILGEEISELYRAFSEHRTTTLAAPPLHYADYTLWQQHYLQSPASERHLAYWQQQFADLPALLALPFDRPPSPEILARGASLNMIVPPSLSEALRAFNRQEGLTTFMTLLTALQITLWHYTGQEDFCIGTPVAQRTRPESLRLIGLLTNTLALRSSLSTKKSTVRQLLHHVRATALAAYTHQDIPFEKLVEVLQPERKVGGNPLFQVMFAMEHDLVNMNAFALDGLRVEPLPYASAVARFDLTLTVSDSGRELHANWEYLSDVFERETIERLAQHWQYLLETMVRHPEWKVEELSLLSPTESQQLSEAWNASVRPYPPGQCIHRLFEEQVRRTPDAIAVVSDDECITYSALNWRANRLAWYLRQEGIGPEVLVGVYMERSLEMLQALFGILKAGGAYIPLDPSYPEERLAFMLQESCAALLLTQQRLMRSALAHALPTVCLDADDLALPERLAGIDPRDPPQSGNLAYVMFTSGSTGQPKGVMVTHQSLVNACFAWESAYAHDNSAACHLQMASFSFDVFTANVVRALCSGGRLVLCPRETVLEPADLYGLMLRAGVDCAEYVPGILRALMHYLQKTGQRLDFMRWLIIGSDSWTAGDLEAVRALCGPYTRIINSYGVTEATIDSLYYECPRQDLSSLSRSVLIGRPFANVQVYILNKHLQPVPIGVPGEIYIGGEGLARGYVHRPDLTAACFLPHPSGQRPGELLYRTGDLARYRRDGTIEFLGRGDQQVKLRGFRIELGEIEATLMLHQDVQQALVVTQQDNARGEELVAYVVARQSSPSDLRSFLQKRLPGYMLPARLVFLDALPLTPQGKLDRLALAQRSPLADAGGHEATVQPATPLQKALAEIWCQVLGLTEISMHDNFFDMGGHSLLAMQLVFQIQEVAALHVPVRRLFEAPTIEAFSVVIEELLMKKLELLSAAEIQELL